LSKQYDDVELPKLVKKAGVDTPQEFDRKLRLLGTSLEGERRAFMERSLAQQWVHQQVKPDEETTYDQMMTYYRGHLQEFTTPARAEWEELMVRFSKYPSKAAAYDAIARMGNRVMGGTPLAEVAKAESDGPTASQGGRRDWTCRGSLVCEALDQALFAQPEGRMGPILEGPTGFHIVRVTRREPDRTAPFLDAQVSIKQKIVQERTQKLFREYMDTLTARTPVWTIYDSDIRNPQLASPRAPMRR
jgi:parvulin-like peptidyl-prolyl isomerase